MGWVVNLFGEYLPNPRGGELHVMMYLLSVCLCLCEATWHSAEVSAKVWQERTYNIVSVIIKLETLNLPNCLQIWFCKSYQISLTIHLLEASAICACIELYSIDSEFIPVNVVCSKLYNRHIITTCMYMGFILWYIGTVMLGDL